MAVLIWFHVRLLFSFYLKAKLEKIELPLQFLDTECVCSEKMERFHQSEEEY